MFLFRFTYNQNKRVKGLSQTAKLNRKNRNLVTMKYNMMNCALETVSTILLLYFYNDLSVIVYILVLSLGTPLVYIIGIKESKNVSKQASLPQVKAFAKRPGPKVLNVTQDKMEIEDLETPQSNERGT